MQAYDVAEHIVWEKALIQKKARRGLLAFTRYTMPTFEINWHHRLICQTINAMLAGLTVRQLLHQFGLDDEEIAERCKQPDKKRLYAGMTLPVMVDEPLRNVMIEMGPRHGKSELVSRRLPAFAFGNYPDMRIIGCSYSADLSSLLNRDVQRIMDDTSYADLFPDTRLAGKNVRAVASGSYLRNSDIFEIVNHQGGYRSAGVGGGITGMGADLALVDDPFKNREEADSPVRRDKVWDWYRSTLYTRLSKHAMQVIINTRWHEADLSGHVIEQAQTDPTAEQFFVLTLPALLDVAPSPGDPRQLGEALWPGKYDEARLKRIWRTIGSKEWASLYQQRPSPEEGNIIKEQWFQRYRVLPDRFDEVIGYADLAFKGKKKSDFCSLQVWGKIGAKKYLLDQVRGRMGFTEQCRAYRKLAEKWPEMNGKYVEDAANASALIETLKVEVPGLKALPVKGDKVARAKAVAPTIEAGDVYIPEAAIAPWVVDYMHEWKTFPNGANDDQVDATTGALGRFASKIGWRTAGVAVAPVSVEKRDRHLYK